MGHARTHGADSKLRTIPDIFRAVGSRAASARQWALSCLDGARCQGVLRLVALGRGCGHVFGLSVRRIGSAGPDVVRRSVASIRPARLSAQTMPRALGSIRFPAHHILVTLDSCAALVFGEPRPQTWPARLTPEFPDRPSCRAGSRRRCAPSCWRAPRRQA